MRSRQILSCVPVLLLVTVSSISPGTAAEVPDEGPAGDTLCEGMLDCTGPTFDVVCDMHTKTCDGGSEPDLPAYPMAGWMLEPLRPFLTPELYDALYELLGGDDKEPNPVPSLPPEPPEETGVELERESSLGFHGADLFLHVGFTFEEAGISVHGESDVSASVAVDRNDPPPAQPGQVPCSDPRGCPDLLVDPQQLLEGGIVVEEFASTDCSVQEGSTEPGQRRLLRFTFASPNLGSGDLIIGDPDDHPEWFEWGDCHDHWHFREYADYRLWTPEAYLEWQEARDDDPDATAEEVFDEHPELIDGFVAGHKQGFCAIDIQRYVPFQISAKYRSCASHQGISSGWGDVYDHRLDGQFVDITDVEPGLYVLEAEVNAERLFQESDYSENSGAVFVVVPPA